MDRQRFEALFMILLGIAMICASVWAMFAWSAAYEASRDYTVLVVQALASNTTIPVFQTDPPFGGSLIGILVPVVFSVWGAAVFIVGLFHLNNEP